MKKGDIVKMSEKNPNHLGYGQCAYANMEGVVDEVYEDGGFVLKTETSSLVVPLCNRKGIWIWLNGEHVYFTNKSKERKYKKENKIVNFIYKLFGL